MYMYVFCFKKIKINKNIKPNTHRNTKNKQNTKIRLNKVGTAAQYKLFWVTWH